MTTETTARKRRPPTKKPVPLTGDFLSTGVSLEKATPTQLNMEMNRLIRIMVTRCSAANESGNVEDDEEYRAACGRNKVLIKLAWQKMKELADLHGIVFDFPEPPY